MDKNRSFDEQYPKLKELDQVEFEGTFLIFWDDSMPCQRCEKPTHFWDGSFHMPLCSPDCERKTWAEYKAFCNADPFGWDNHSKGA